MSRALANLSKILKNMKENTDLIENEFSLRSRELNLKKLKSEEFDLLIIGGGITGAGAACEAFQRGLKTALVEKSDFASGTSSKSSKLLHGGFRYLEKFKFRLVFESLKDRNELFRKIPHIARPMSFVAPIYKNYKETVMLMNMGISLYDFLSFASRNMITKIHKLLGKNGISHFEPEIRKEGLKGGIQYFDGACDDARLTLENIKTAGRNQVCIANYLEVTGFIKDEKGKATAVNIKDLISGEEFSVKAKSILNATGPWVDSVNKRDDHNYENKLKPTKGVHLILPRITEGNAILLKTPSAPVRWVFIIPYQEWSIVGTTDTEYHGNENDYSYLDEDNYAGESEINYLLETVNYYYPEANFGKKDIISSYGGWRPLIAPPKGQNISESDISREHEIFETESGIICIAGGKLTTYMSMSKEILDYLEKNGKIKSDKNNARNYPALSSWDSNLSLEEYLDVEARKYSYNERTMIRRLIRKYGTEYRKLYEIMAADPYFREEVKGLSNDAVCYRAEVLYSVYFEMTVKLSDFMLRRNRIILKDKNQGLMAAEEIAGLIGESLANICNWENSYKNKWINQEILEYKKEVEKVNSGKLEAIKK